VVVDLSLKQRPKWQIRSKEKDWPFVLGKGKKKGQLRPDQGRKKRGRWDSFYVVSGNKRDASPFMCCVVQVQFTVGAMAKKAGDGNRKGQGVCREKGKSVGLSLSCLVLVSLFFFAKTR
jgi:hypothetical protein